MNLLTRLFSILLFFIMSNACWAHAVLIQSTPQDHANLQKSPREIVLRFNGKIEKKVSQVTLLDSQGHKVSIPTSDKGYSGGAPDSLVVPMPPLNPGTYQLQYRILAIDGHATPGRLSFSISEKTPT
jgi:methionine-rich copper-binding protein CopC